MTSNPPPQNSLNPSTSSSSPCCTGLYKIHSASDPSHTHYHCILCFESHGCSRCSIPQECCPPTQVRAAILSRPLPHSEIHPNFTYEMTAPPHDEDDAEAHEHCHCQRCAEEKGCVYCGEKVLNEVQAEGEKEKGAFVEMGVPEDEGLRWDPALNGLKKLKARN